MGVKDYTARTNILPNCATCLFGRVGQSFYVLLLAYRKHHETVGKQSYRSWELVPRTAGSQRHAPQQVRVPTSIPFLQTALNISPNMPPTSSSWKRCPCIPYPKSLDPQTHSPNLDLSPDGDRGTLQPMFGPIRTNE